MKKLFLGLMLLVLFSHVALAQQRALSTYGYFDLEYEQSNKDDKGRMGTFDQHHFNVITSYVLDPHFRILAEIEWEHGVEFSGSGGIGEIKLERSWVEYKHSEALKIRAGKFLPAYGIFNRRHDATPTFLSSFLPNSIYGKHKNPLGGKQRLFAKFANGLQVIGTVYADAWSLKYVGYLSNGQGGDAFKADDNSNKAIGGRLLVGLPIEDLHLGTSYYSEKNGKVNDTRQRSLAVDGAFDFSNVQLKSEAAWGRLEKVDEEGIPNDEFQETFGIYAQAAYTFAERLTPFVRYDFFDPNPGVGDDGEIDVTVGLNFSVTPRVYLKSEVHLISYQNSSKEGYELFVTSIAVAF